MKTMRTTLAAVALATVTTLGAGITLATAVDAQTDPVETQDPADTSTDRMQRHEERLQAKVDNGVITQERADEIRIRMAERAAQREIRQADRVERTEELAALLDTTANELTAQLREGMSLAEIADEAGIDINIVIDHIETQMTERINQAVADGHIDQARADEKLETLRDDITDRVNGERPDGRRGFDRRGLDRGGVHGHGFGRHHHGGN